MPQSRPAAPLPLDHQPGAVIRAARLDQGLTLAALGTLCGLSGSQVSRYERGKSHPDVATLRRFAAALDIPLLRLGLANADPVMAVRELRPGFTLRARDTAEDGDRVRRREMLGLSALAGVSIATPAKAESADGIPHSLERVLLHSSGEPLPLARLHTALHRARTDYEACRYAEVAEDLSDLIGSAHAAVADGSGGDRDAASLVLADAYILMSDLATKANQGHVAWVSADRALQITRGSSDPIATAGAARAVAIAMRRAGRHDSAVDLLTRTAGDITEYAPGRAATTGALLCSASYAAAQSGDRDRAVDLLAEAGRLATGGGPGRLTSDEVLVYAISVHNALGEPSAALAAARRVRPQGLPTAERFARYAVDTARAWAAHGDLDRACGALRVAGQRSPEELRRPSVAALIADLRNRPTPPRGIGGLVTRAGLRG
ncbi:hypothetical protein GCM10022221_50230 [Actinocorallia aurea]